MGVAVGGIGRHGLFELDDGVAIVALFDQVVALAEVIEGFGRLGEGRCAQKREGETEQAAVLQNGVLLYKIVKGVGRRLATGVEPGLDFAGVGKATFLQLGKDQLAIEAEFKPPSV